jgi:ubiquinone/menaquinone biosynthesis C-methylase UbiE
VKLAVVRQLLFPSVTTYYGRHHGPIAQGAVRPQDVAVSSGREPLWMNLGYWRAVEAITGANHERWGELLVAAQANMARLLADTAPLGCEDDLLDCGCGYGDQDILWAEEFRPRSITGLDVTPHNVEIAGRRAEILGLSGKVSFRQGSATDLPFADASFDVVFALECAFHFDTREDFLREALRVLRPGGRLVLADMHRNNPRGGRWRVRLRRTIERRLAHIPTANLIDTTAYRVLLERIGFSPVSISSLSEDVWRPYTKVLLLNRLEGREAPPDRAVIGRVLARVERSTVDELYWPAFVDLDEYSLVRAERPRR